jgi:hypothetical protein
MTENRVERLKIYNGIKDQKIDYLNQWHRDTEDFYGRNRAEAADLINRMRESYADYVRCLNTYKALQETQTAMMKTRSLDAAEVQQQNKEAEIILGFETQAQQFHQKQEDFTNFMDRLKDNIDEKAAQFGYIPYYEATLRDKEPREIAQSSEQLQDLEPRRKRLVAISPYVAKHAKLPPTPNVEQKMYDDFAIDLLEEALRAETIPEEEPPAASADAAAGDTDTIVTDEAVNTDTIVTDEVANTDTMNTDEVANTDAVAEASAETGNENAADESVTEDSVSADASAEIDGEEDEDSDDEGDE